MVIEKYKSPVGDGNGIMPPFHPCFLQIEKYKSPVGDGNKFVFAVNAT